MTNNESEYILLLEKSLLLVQKRADLLQKVIGNYGSHKVEEHLKNIRSLEVSINEHNSKIQAFKEGKTS